MTNRRRCLVLALAGLVLAGCGADGQDSTTAAPATAEATTPATSTPVTSTPVTSTPVTSTPVTSTPATVPSTVPAATGSGAGTADTVTVAVFQFQPVPLTVPAGTTVTFANRDETTHEPMSGAPGAVTSAFDVRLEGRGATATVTLTEPGSYPYFCGIHDAMTGEIVVTG